jgi:hypothetical protein
VQGKPRRGAVRKAPPKARVKADPGLVATLPGFEMLADGSSRLFVELTHAANVTEKREVRRLSYLIHGARVVHRNNENALVTVHFNTPVSRARLLPARGDLVFSVDLRADSEAVWRVVEAAEGRSVLQIDFPRGAFLPPGEGETGVAVIQDAEHESQHTPGAHDGAQAPANAAQPPATAQSQPAPEAAPPAPAPAPAPAQPAPAPAPAPAATPAPAPARTPSGDGF